MKKRFFACIAGMLLSSILIIGCGKEENPVNVHEFGEIENIDNQNNSTEENNESESQARLPVYDPMSATQPLAYPEDRKLETKKSYYKEQLEPRPRRAFDAIYNAANNMVSSIEFESSQLVTPSELENIMHILFLDCPEVFWLDTAFTYQTNSEGYVNRVEIYFNMTPQQIQETEDSITRNKPSVVKNIGENDYDSIKNILAGIMKNFSKYGSVVTNPDGTIDFGCTNPFSSGLKNSIGDAKLITYWLRECGIDATVGIGEPVSDTLLDKYELTTDYINFRETSNTEGFYTIRYNYTCYWMWNIVKIDDKWYNLDFTYSKLLNGCSKSDYSDDSLYFVPDLVMSQTRLSYMNEEILGIMPSCTDCNFQTSYREGWYILPHNETQVLIKLKDIISYCDSKNLQAVKYQCEDEATFNYIIKNIDEQIANYNEANGNPIGSYKKEFIRDCLIINIYDIIHNY